MTGYSTPKKKTLLIVLAILVCVSAMGALLRTFLSSPPSRDKLGLSALSMTDENGVKWTLDLAKGQTLASIKDRDSKPGAPVLIKTDVKIDKREVSIGLVIEGQAGEQYAGGAKRNGRWLPAPGFKILDSNGKILVNGAFKYG